MSVARIHTYLTPHALTHRGTVPVQLCTIHTSTERYGAVRSSTEQYVRNRTYQYTCTDTHETFHSQYSSTYIVEISIVQLCCVDHPGPYKWSVATCRRYAVSDRSIDWRHRVDLNSAHSFPSMLGNTSCCAYQLELCTATCCRVLLCAACCYARACSLVSTCAHSS